MDIQKIIELATQRGLSAINSIRNSITPQNIPNPVSPPIRQTINQFRTPLPSVPSLQTKAITPLKDFNLESRFLKPFNVAPKPEIQASLNIKPEIQQKINEFQKPIFDRQAGVIASIPKRLAKTGGALAEFAKIGTAIRKKDINAIVPDLNKVLDGLETFSTFNDLFIQPFYDTGKLTLALAKGQKFDTKTQQSILRGEKPELIYLNDILGNTEQNTDPVVYNLIRFADFAPALIDIPLGPIGKTQKFAKEFKKLDNAGNFSPKLEKIILQKLAQFEQTIGRKLTPEETISIRKNIAKPTDIENAFKKSNQAIQPIGKGLENISSGNLNGAIPPSGGIPAFLPEAGRVLPTKERRFPSITVKESASTAKGLKDIVDNTFYLYSPIKNKEEYAKAVSRVETGNIDEIIDALKYTDDPIEVSYTGQALMQKLQKEGNFARASDVLNIVSESATKSGQAIQALSVWGKLTPEGALKTANNAINKYNIDNKLLPESKGFLKLTESKIKAITEQAKKVQLLGNDITPDKAREVSLLQRLIASVIPKEFGAKLSAFQTLAQLLNPKTLIRNLIGNTLFGSIDAVTQNFASLLDLAISLYTKKRTIAPASIKRLFKGGVEGFQIGLKDALAGADTSQLASQFDLPNASVFDSKIMQGLEKLLNIALRVPDRSAYQATYKDTLEGLMDLAKTDKPTKEMLEIAHYEGLRRTFQDDSASSRFFVSGKQFFNQLGIKGFGLGDLILKYPKTPGNLLARSIEYTPLGYVSAVYELARPLMGQAFDQRAFANNVARATVGTGLLNLGKTLYDQGIITSRPNSDADARTAMDLQGIKSYAFNVSALKRFVLSGFDKEAGKPRVGDQLYSYDWAQPAVFPLAMGANIAENEGKVKNGSFADKAMLSFGSLGAEIIKSSDTLTEQPLLQGMKQLFGGGGSIAQGLLDVVVGSASSFVPTILNQINQYTDNTSRETYSPNYFNSAYNKFSAKIPLLAQKLPARSDILGRPKEKFPNASNTFFNVFFNPAFTDQIKADPVLKEVISIYEETGEKTQFPRLVQKSIKVNGESILLDTDQLVNYQRELGGLANTLISDTLRNPEYQKLPTTEKAIFIGNLLSDANKITKIKLFNDNAEKLSGRENLLLNNDVAEYLDLTITNKQKQLDKEKDEASGIIKQKIKKAKKTKLTGRRKALPRPKKLKLSFKTPKIKKIKQKKFKPLKLKTKPKNIL